jgi:Cu-Zn family superoxide dismutase
MKHASTAFLVSMLVLGGCAAGGNTPSRGAVANIEPLAGGDIKGNVVFTEIEPGLVRVTGELKGQTEGPKGFHIHEKGDCSDPKGMSAGGHFNPTGEGHGGPNTPSHHAGDLGNVVFNELGQAKVNMVARGISVSRQRPDGIIGRSAIVHADADDLKTNPSGNSGARLACGVIKPLR